MDVDEPSGRRRAWRTEQQWSQLRERIVAADADPGRSAETTAILRRQGLAEWGWRTLIAAALMIATVGLTLFARARLVSPSAVQKRFVSTGPGERLAIHLPDSSVVTLGPLSRLRYELTPTRRAIELSGLASFRVVHDSARPLVVHANHASVQDLGTEFVVRAYPEDSVVVVSVSSGVVALSRAGEDASMLTLESGMLGTLPTRGAPIVRTQMDTSLFGAWIEGGLAFDAAEMTDVAREMRQWFGVEVRVGDSAIARRRVSGVYADPSLTGVLDALVATLGKDVRWQRSPDGRTILIQRRP